METLDIDPIQSIESMRDELIRRHHWLIESYARTGLSSRDRRETARELVELANQIDLLVLRQLIYTSSDVNERARLSRKYVRTQMTLRPPARYWLRYTLIAVTSASAVFVAQYGFSIFIAG